jgi:hypothetical protein
MNTKLTFTQKYSYSIVIGACLLFLAYCCSCSSRTVNKSENKTDSTATNKTKVAVKETETIKENTKSDSTVSKKKETIVNIFEDALELEPIDPKQESSFTDSNGNKKTFKNVRIKRNQSQNNSTINESENIRLIEQKNSEIARLSDSIASLNNSIELSKNNSAKEAKKEQFNWSTFVLSFWWLWILIIIALYLAYRYYRGFLKFPFL